MKAWREGREEREGRLAGRGQGKKKPFSMAAVI